MIIRELKQGETHLYKELRLRALIDAPDSFGETFENAKARGEEIWEFYFSTMLPPNIQRMYVAELNGEFVGSAYALQDKGDTSIGRIGGMWVDSSQRNLGAGKLLVTAVEQWAVKNNLKKVRFWVFDQAESALPFYLKMGYRKSGVVDKNHDGRTLIEMEKVIDEVID